MATKKLETASVLAFERKHANSGALMYSGNWQNRTDPDNWQPLIVQSKDVRGTISNRQKAGVANDPMKMDAAIQNANLQRVDVASLPFSADTLKVSFTLRVLGSLATPSVCNSQPYQEALSEVINDYIKREQFTELSYRYAENIANGRFLWRNRVGAEAIEVRVRQIAEGNTLNQWAFDGHDFDLRVFGSRKERIEPLAEVIRQGLLGDQYVLLRVEAYARLGAGQEVFPSQELMLDNSGNSKKSKYLYQMDGVAAMHSQKVGNAIRTIDTWYPQADTYGPIAVEPYGSVTSRGTAYRQPKEKADFYSLLDNWVLKGQIPEEGNQHYVMATLIRGGVFGAKAE